MDSYDFINTMYDKYIHIYTYLVLCAYLVVANHVASL